MNDIKSVKTGILRASLLLLGALLVSCGGGGGGAAPPAPLGSLNDTGQTQCDNGSNVMEACTSTNSGDTSAMPRQDANFGRDAQATAATLVKIGAGAAGFDYTKVCMNGALNCATTASNAAAPAATDWACTKDNHTNLIWSLETQTAVWATATTTLPNAANTAGRCGFNSGWRLPTRRELLSIVHNGVASPAIDIAYFPGTTATLYWSNDTYAPDPAYAWPVFFLDGSTFAYNLSNSYSVRLVRSGQ